MNDQVKKKKSIYLVCTEFQKMQTRLLSKQTELPWDMAEDTLENYKLKIEQRNKSNIIMMEVNSGILQETRKEV